MPKAPTPATWRCTTCGDETDSEVKPGRKAGTRPCKNPLGHSWIVKAK